MAEESGNTLRAVPGEGAGRGPGFWRRMQVLRAGFDRRATGFVSQPEPRSFGSYARGRQLLAGNFHFAGELVAAPDCSIWDVPAPGPAFDIERHGFVWLDDLAAAAGFETRSRSQAWLAEWIARYGTGRGPGWAPDVTGRRVVRWIHHALFVLAGSDRAFSERFFRSLGRQAGFLARAWRGAPPGLPRFEALTGLLYAGLSLTGKERLVKPAMRALARECAAEIDRGGGIPSRNPEELLGIFTLLIWAAAALREAGRQPLEGHVLAIERMAPALRVLRHADGSLARFHGGGRGPEGQLDRALAESGVRSGKPGPRAMGFERLAQGRTSVIVDAAQPPAPPHSRAAHASTLAFEMTSGRRPVIVSCGSGQGFDAAWRRAARATASHSTLAIDGLSSSRFAASTRPGPEFLYDLPRTVVAERSDSEAEVALLLSHDGYVPTHGLRHVRRLALSRDGRTLSGEDALGAFSAEEQLIFERAFEEGGGRGVPFSVRFHIHPEVEAELDLGGRAVSLALRSGEVWVFRHDGDAELCIEPSVYLESGRLKPRATKQLVLKSRVIDYATHVNWSFAKAQETPLNLRDFAADELELDRG